jgi:hypothetical protein
MKAPLSTASALTRLPGASWPVVPATMLSLRRVEGDRREARMS